VGDTEPPPTEVLTRVAGTAADARLRLSLSRGGGWTGRSRRTLTLENLTAAPLTVRLAAAPSSGAVLRMADTVDVGASGRHALPIQVRPRGRRWAGGIRSIPYAIEASSGDGSRASVSGAIREWPVWWLPGSGLLGVAVLVVALVLGLSSGGGGGVAAEEEAEQQQDEELVTAVRPPTRAEIDAYVENLTAISESFDSRTAAAQTRLLQCEQESGDLAFFTCAAREWDTLGIEYGQTRGELTQLNVAPSLRADHEVLSQNFDAWIDAVLDARRTAQDCARRLTSGCSTDYEDARLGVLDAQDELLEGLSLPVAEALAPLFASG